MHGLRRRPDGEHHRETGALEPEPPEVVVRGRVFERRTQRSVPDQQLRLGVLAERDMLGVREEHLCQDDRSRRLRGDRDRPHLLGRSLRDQLNGLDCALAGDTQARHEAKPICGSRVLDRRDRRDVELAGDELTVEIRRDPDDLLDLGFEPVEDRRHVDVPDAA